MHLLCFNQMMNKSLFMPRFHLFSLANTRHTLFPVQKNKHAAVLIPIFEEDNQLRVLLTLRSTHLKYHAGQVCFPGGKVEKTDLSLIDTALREAEEEIGLSRSECTVIGKLHAYQTLSGFKIEPIVALIASDHALLIDKNEVAEVFSVPLRFFLNTNNHFTINSQINGLPHPVTFIPYLNYNIWGATAAILKSLADHLIHK